MKLLLVADLHYTLPQWDWLDATAERFDIVVIAGDLLELNSIVPREAQIVVLRKYLQRIAKKVPLLVCSGNHDTLDSPQGKTAQWLQDKHDAKYWTDGEHYTADNLFFSILPWWESETDQIATERQLERDASQAMGKRWIWVYHPPQRESNCLERQTGSRRPATLPMDRALPARAGFGRAYPQRTLLGRRLLDRLDWTHLVPQQRFAIRPSPIVHRMGNPR